MKYWEMIADNLSKAWLLLLTFEESHQTCFGGRKNRQVAATLA